MARVRSSTRRFRRIPRPVIFGINMSGRIRSGASLCARWRAALTEAAERRGRRSLPAPATPGEPTSLRVRRQRPEPTREPSRAPLTLPQSLELGSHMFLAAIGTDGMAEPGVCVFRDVALDLLPVLSVVADLLAPGTDRKQPLKCLHARQGLLQGGDPAGEFLLQADDPHADVDA